MIRLLLILYFATVSVSADPKCPDGYLMQEGHCIRLVYRAQHGVIGDMMSKAMEICNEDGATLPIIRSQAEDSAFIRIALTLTVETNFWLILGAVCNSSTRRLEWMDGSKITYINTRFYPKINLDFDCVADPNHIVASRPYYYEDWIVSSTTFSTYVTILCVADPNKPLTTTTKPKPTTTTSATTTTVNPFEEECDNYELITFSKVEKKPCFKIFTDPLSWREAQKKCAADFGSLATINNEEENKIIWSSAVSQNLLDGVHIGAYQSSVDGTWRWIDDDNIISGYKNFAGGFPVPGLGRCSGMLTESTNGIWINEDCDYQQLPFVCRRNGYSESPKECPQVAPAEGTDILAPGFPIPGIPCEYMLIVDAKSVIQLEILALEANPSMDFLEISEGAIGKNLLVNLTGTNPSPSTYFTKTSNVMRVNWKPNVNNRPPEYRGFRIRYRAIASGK